MKKLPHRMRPSPRNTEGKRKARTTEKGVKDKFGLFWQVVPDALGELMGDPDPEKSQRVMDAMLKMSKIEIAGLKRAYDGG
jgi:predicted 3-demethylubiquinone-9 3-methyltransferase (glyoxalase superfamily)